MVWRGGNLKKGGLNTLLEQKFCKINKVLLFWILAMVFPVVFILYPIPGERIPFVAVFQLIGYFALAAGTVYHSLAKQGLTCGEIFDQEVNENYCFSAVLLSFVFQIDFGYGIFSGVAGAFDLEMVIIIIILYSIIALLRAAVRKNECEHPLVKD